MPPLLTAALKIHMNISSSADKHPKYIYKDNISDDPTEILSTPVRRQVSPFSKPGKRLVSLKKPKSDRNEANIRAVKIKAAVVLDDPKDELRDKPFAKRVRRRKTLVASGSTTAWSTGNLTPPMAASSPVDSPHWHSSESPSDSSASDTSSPPPKVGMTKKRKLEATSGWEPVNDFYSRQKIKHRPMFRCTLCLNINEEHYCRRIGDMNRHLKSLKHKEKGYFCGNSGCQSSFTREDGLKRHKENCTGSSTTSRVDSDIDVLTMSS